MKRNIGVFTAGDQLVKHLRTENVGWRQTFGIVSVERKRKFIRLCPLLSKTVCCVQRKTLIDENEIAHIITLCMYSMSFKIVVIHKFLLKHEKNICVAVMVLTFMNIGLLQDCIASQSHSELC